MILIIYNLSILYIMRIILRERLGNLLILMENLVSIGAALSFIVPNA